MSGVAGTERVLRKLVTWGAARNDVRGIAIVGSQARTDHPADRWSDLDLILLARRPRRFLADASWVDEIETPWLSVLEPTVIGEREIHHFTFEGGVKLDVVAVSSLAFGLAARAIELGRRHPSALRLLPAIARDRLAELSDLLDRGHRLVLDKDRIARRLQARRPAAPAACPPPPSQDEFTHLVRCFFNEQLSSALKLRRGELFIAKTASESRVMSILGQMIEWHGRVTSERWSPVFEHGRFLEEWAPPAVIEGLRRAFSRYDASETWRARLATLELFCGLARETAARLGYLYPHEQEERVTTWLREQAHECAAV